MFEDQEKLREDDKKYFLNLLVEAHKQQKEFGMSGLDLDSHDGLVVAAMSSDAVVIPNRDRFDRPSNIVVFRDANALARWDRVTQGEQWPYFEDELRDKIKNA